MIFTLSKLLLPLPVPNHARMLGVDPPPPHVVSVELAAKGLGSAGCVEIPPQTWDNVVEETSLSAMAGVQLTRAEVSPVVLAMTQALHEQGHLVQIEKGMPGWGSKPSAPVFVIPKSDVKCSFIMNCKEGNRRDPNPHPSMRLPNMWSVRRRLLFWKGSRHVQGLHIYACTFDLSNYFTSLRLPPHAWGTFRVQGEGADMFDLRSLPFGWKLSPPICQSVVGAHVRQAFDILVSTMGSPDVVEYDHYLDDVLVVREGPPQWLRDCMVWLAKFMQAKGYLVSPKSVLEPGRVVKWLGKEVDLVNFSIANLLGLQVRIVAYLVKIFDSHISVKDLQRVMGLINWMATPATGHLPFLGGVYCAVAGSNSGWLNVTQGMWLALVSAIFVATPPFRAPDCYVKDWLFIKWISVDAAEFLSRSGVKLYRIGIFDPAGGARALVCPRWVDNQQVAELYEVWMMLKIAVRRKLPQVLMLQDNVAAIWAACQFTCASALEEAEPYFESGCHAPPSLWSHTPLSICPVCLSACRPSFATALFF